MSIQFIIMGPQHKNGNEMHIKGVWYIQTREIYIHKQKLLSRSIKKQRTPNRALKYLLTKPVC